MALVKVQKPSQVLQLQHAGDVVEQATKQLDKDLSLFSKFAVTVMDKGQSLEILACKNSFDLSLN